MVSKIKKAIKKILGLASSEKLVGWHGNYATWQDAEKLCEGYNANHILEKVLNATLQVKNGQACYERDSILFYTLDYNLGLISVIQKAYIETNKKLKIVDFGGALGSCYFQNKKMLNDIPFEWYIIEQDHYVKKGQEFLEDSQLKFVSNFEEITDCDIILFSSVLHYLPNPWKIIEEAIKQKAKYIFIDRTSFIDDQKELITIQYTPAQIYEATYPCRFFNENQFLKAFKKYDCIANVQSTIEREYHSNEGKRLYWKGFLLKHRN